MFDSLTSKLESTFNKLRGKGKLSEADLEQSMADIRTALLEADVNFKVTKDFCESIKEKALGMEVQKSLSPGQMVVKFVHDELIKVMGEHSPLNLRFAPPVVLMVVGLQGSGKTTSCGKLAKYLVEEQKRRPLLVSVDVYRPAAIEQLKKLGESLKVNVFASSAEENPVDICNKALAYATNTGFDTLIIDTAGRLQIDQQLMTELADIVEAVEPHEILLVVDAMTGQEAVNVAKGFDERLDVDGMILTKLDGDARGGAALSMRAVTGKPIKFIGVGEKSDALEVFHPDRMASRILGMGDVLSLIEKATKQVSMEDAKKLHKKMKKNDFNFNDFLTQMQTVKNMGSMSSLIKMLPGMGQALKGVDEDLADREMKKVEAMILSMTKEEREQPDLINGSRRARIAKGSGTSVEEMNKLLQQFSQMRKMMKKLTNLSPSSLKGMGNLSSLMGGGGFKFPGR
ncbi:MAG: signal recognition particle protein [Proteobacteria bacterium]|nr:signal recognition particle protein [Pseudomonadota bacterium]